MTRARAGVGAFLLVALAASAGSLAVQLAFAGSAILLYGMLHGVSDLLIAPRANWPALLLFYAGAVIGTLLWWRVAPFTALIAFLLLSAIHFGTDDAPPERVAERWCRGVLMIGGPALLHGATLAGLFEALTGAPAGSALLADTLRIGAAGALALLPFAVISHDRGHLATLAVGMAALVLLPPLVGFAVAFTMLHARPQLAARMAALGCDRLADYGRRTAPVLAGAAAVVGGAALLFVDGPAPALSTVFAALAALATPHMLSPPGWRAGEAPSRRRAIAGRDLLVRE